MRSFRASRNLLPAIIIAFSCVALVVSEGHVEVDWSNAATYINVLCHKCGLIMLTSFVWVAFELVRSAFFPSDSKAVRHVNLGMRLNAGRRLLQ